MVLASGKESDFYVDCKRTALTAEGHALVGRLLFDRIRRLRPLPRGAGGLTLGADPLASAVALTSWLEYARRAEGSRTRLPRSERRRRRAQPADGRRRSRSIWRPRGGLIPPAG